MGTRAEADESPTSPFPQGTHPSSDSLLVEGSAQIRSQDACGSGDQVNVAHLSSEREDALHSDQVNNASASSGSIVKVPIAQQDSKSTDALHSSAAAFVQGGIQDACDDACSICLEPFCESDPATVTSCKHDYHLQCILEWAQRSKDCPMCWQPLSFEDPNSQELFDAIEQERSPPWTQNSLDGIQFHQVPAFANYADFEERIMQHLAHQLARRGSLHNRISSMHDNAFMHPSNQALLRTTRAVLEQPVDEARQTRNHGDTSSHNHGNSEARLQEMESLSREMPDHSPQRTPTSDISSLSESLKSRFMVASSKWKETLTRTTHGFKERWRARSNTTTDFRARAQEVSADVVRQAIKRISPDSVGKDNDVATTSSSSPKAGSDESFSKAVRTRCTSNNQLEGVASTGISIHAPGEAV